MNELRVCDPACGTMNFGLVALEMLREMYREEGYDEQREIDRSIIQNNLVGFDIDPTAIELGVKSLEIKTGLEIREHRLRVTDALFELLLIMRAAQEQDTFSRLRVCANDECRWAFYDRSKNRQGHWCNMALCGNRLKNRDLRARRREEREDAGDG